MSDYFEIDFLDVESKKSGDAIPIRYCIDDVTRIHITDGGFQDTGDKIIEHVGKYYDNPSTIDAVIVSHSDQDHAGGLCKVLETYDVTELWMLRPWLYAEELIDRFKRFTNVENLASRLQEIYPTIATLEEIAEEKEIPILAPFQGENIGDFIVLAPTKSRYLDLVVESDKTPEAAQEKDEFWQEKACRFAEKVISFVRAAWGEETFSSEETSPENDMSVVQYANLCDKRILLTADAGRGALTEAADYAPSVGLELPGINTFQVPHHGSRRNVSTEILDCLLGERLSEKPEELLNEFKAIISASKDDEDHPRKAVIRACIHRGGTVLSNQGSSLRTGHNVPEREGWSAASPLPYPEEQEED